MKKLSPCFTSDWHIGHGNIIKFCQRPFAVDKDNPTKEEVLAMGETLIANHNAIVKPGQEFHDLGDFAYKCPYDYALECWKRRNGRPHFTAGNHDALVKRIYRNHPDLFASYKESGYRIIKVEDQHLFLNHYAQLEWWHALQGTWHLFGHTHANLIGLGKSMDVGVDNTNFKPVTFDEIKEFMDNKPVGAHAQFQKFH
jgi:calcineurin-like phosphoesterase family protein